MAGVEPNPCVFKTEAGCRIVSCTGFRNECKALPDYEETPNQQRERNNPKVEGSWFVYAYDHAAYPIGLFAEEVDALRLMAHLGYGYVVFWPFGVTWDDVKNK